MRSLDKRPSYAERFSCLVGLEGSRSTCLLAGMIGRPFWSCVDDVCVNTYITLAGSASGGAGNGGGHQPIVPSFEGKAALLRHLLRTERAYAERLAGFKAAFIDPVEKRDTEDRRRLRSLPKLVVALELLVAVGEWNAELLRGLEACVPPAVVAVSAEGGRKGAPVGEEEGEETEDGGAFDVPRIAELFARSAPGACLRASARCCCAQHVCSLAPPHHLPYHQAFASMRRSRETTRAPCMTCTPPRSR